MIKQLNIDGHFITHIDTINIFSTNIQQSWQLDQNPSIIHFAQPPQIIQQQNEKEMPTFRQNEQADRFNRKCKDYQIVEKQLERKAKNELFRQSDYTKDIMKHQHNKTNNHPKNIKINRMEDEIRGFEDWEEPLLKQNDKIIDKKNVGVQPKKAKSFLLNNKQSIDGFWSRKKPKVEVYKSHIIKAIPCKLNDKAGPAMKIKTYQQMSEFNVLRNSMSGNGILILQKAKKTSKVRKQSFSKYIQKIKSLSCKQMAQNEPDQNQAISNKKIRLINASKLNKFRSKTEQDRFQKGYLTDQIGEQYLNNLILSNHPTQCIGNQAQWAKGRTLQTNSTYSNIYSHFKAQQSKSFCLMKLKITQNEVKKNNGKIVSILKKLNHQKDTMENRHTNFGARSNEEFKVESKHYQPHQQIRSQSSNNFKTITPSEKNQKRELQERLNKLRQSKVNKNIINSLKTLYTNVTMLNHSKRMDKLISNSHYRNNSKLEGEGKGNRKDCISPIFINLSTT